MGEVDDTGRMAQRKPWRDPRSAMDPEPCSPVFLAGLRIVVCLDSHQESVVEADSKRRIKQLTAALAAARQELEACRDSLQRTESALCAVADGLAIVDLHGRISSLNPVATHMTGWTEEESLGQPLSEIVRFTDARGRSVDVLAEGFSNGHDEIVSLRRRDGHVILVDGAVALVNDRDKRAIGTIVTFRNVTAAARLTRELAFHANHDPLTGLHNRRAFDSRLQRAIASAGELGCCHCVLYFDLDQFKRVNDGAGHVAGDELLRQLALLLRRQLRERDSLARIGGDEFAVLLENCNAARAAQVAEKIRTAIAGFEFTWGARVFRVGSSIGLVDFADGKLSAAQLMGIADRMCYAAKAGGRDQVATYERKGSGETETARDVPRRPGKRAEASPPAVRNG
jgi:diguanylate cyclase (GGDEF)-like protein/PAS domain S-box-containing protein